MILICDNTVQPGAEIFRKLIFTCDYKWFCHVIYTPKDIINKQTKTKQPIDYKPLQDRIFGYSAKAESVFNFLRLHGVLEDHNFIHVSSAKRSAAIVTPVWHNKKLCVSKWSYQLIWLDQVLFNGDNITTGGRYLY